jgi:hypothetical protein
MFNSVTKATAANAKLATAILAGVILSCSGLAASAVTTYDTSGAPTQMSLGDTIGSPYDQLTIQGANGTLSSSTTSIVLNTLTFTAGVNAIIPATYTNQFSFSESLTINTSSGSGSGTLTVPFNLAINYSDTLTVVGGSQISVAAGGDIWTIVVNALTIGPNAGGSMSELLTASVSETPSATPLPAAIVLFGSGLGMMELVRRRKKAKQVSLA